jgi:hypothetical protein
MRHDRIDPPVPARWAVMLAEHRASLREILRLAAKHPRDLGLDACRVWAERQLRELLADAAYPSSIGDWGRNGKGPAIASQLHSARTFAELAERRERRAA